MNNGCDHLCISSGTGHKQCLCAIGFQLDPTDKRTCHAADELILYSSSWGINSLLMKNFTSKNDTLDEQSKITVNQKFDSPSITKAIRASSLEFDNSGSLFMADSDDGSITKIRLDNSGFRTLLSGIQNLGDFIYDW